MFKRHKKNLKNLVTEEFHYDYDKLVFQNDEKNTYEKINENEKYNFLINLIDKNINDNNLFSNKNLYFLNTNEFINKSEYISKDVIKFAFQELKTVLSDFEDENEKNKDENKLISLEKNIFNKIMYELYFTNEIQLKYLILECLLSLTVDSVNITSFFINDKDFFNLLLNLTYIKNKDIVNDIIIILTNCFIDNSKEIYQILKDVPINIRLKEIILNNDLHFNDPKFLYNCFELIFVLSNILNNDELNEEQNNFYYNIFSIYLEILKDIINKGISFKYTNIFVLSLKILKNLSYNNKISSFIVAYGLGFELIQILKIPNLEIKYLLKILEIMQNLLVPETNVTYFLNSKILDIFNNILYEYINSTNSLSIEIIVLIIINLDNIVRGNEEQINILLSNNIVKFIINIMKVKKNNQINKECLILFYDLCCFCSDNDFITVRNLKAFEIFCTFLDKSSNKDFIIYCLHGIIICVERMNKLFKTYQDLKNEFNYNCGKRNVEKLLYNKDKEIAAKSAEIYNILSIKNDLEDIDMQH